MSEAPKTPEERYRRWVTQLDLLDRSAVVQLMQQMVQHDGPMQDEVARAFRERLGQRVPDYASPEAVQDTREWIDALNAVKAERDAAIEDARARISELEQLLREAESARDIARTDREVGERRRAKEITKLHRARNALREEVSRLNRRIAELEAEVGMAVEAGGYQGALKAEDEAHRLRSRIRELEAEAGQLRERGTLWVLEKETMFGRLEEMKAERDATRARVAELERSAQEESDEFNAGWDAARRGEPDIAEPSGLKHDQWGIGWAWAMEDRRKERISELEAEAARLRGSVVDVTTHLEKVEQIRTQSDRALARAARYREALDVIAKCPPDAVHLMPLAARAALADAPTEAGS